MSSGIYKITNTINGRFYIGSAVSISKRWNVHKSQLRNGKHHSATLQRAWNKYGEDAFEFSVVEYVDRERLLEVEQEYIDRLNPCDPKVGYNISKMASAVCLKGPDNPNYGKPMSGMQKEKIRQSLLGHEVSEETRTAISKSCKGLLTGRKNPMYGLPVSQERRRAQSEKMKGRFSGENNPAARPVIKYDLDMNFLGAYATAKQAAATVGGDNSNISTCCRGRYKTAYGYIWRYATEVIK